MINFRAIARLAAILGFCRGVHGAAAEPPRPVFRAVDIDTKIEIGYEVTVADVDDDSLIQGRTLACGDLLGTGTSQIVVGWRGNKSGDKVGTKLFIPLDDQGAKWKQVIVDDNSMACEDLWLADLNADGRPDVVAAGRSTKNMKVYFGPAAGVSNK